MDFPNGSPTGRRTCRLFGRPRVDALQGASPLLVSPGWRDRQDGEGNTSRLHPESRGSRACTEIFGVDALQGASPLLVSTGWSDQRRGESRSRDFILICKTLTCDAPSAADPTPRRVSRKVATYPVRPEEPRSAGPATGQFVISGTSEVMSEQYSPTRERPAAPADRLLVQRTHTWVTRGANPH